MQLDSKESDIEQLREKLNDLQQRMDNSSVTSLQTDETDSNIAGRVTKWRRGLSSSGGFFVWSSFKGVFLFGSGGLHRLVLR